MKTGSTLVALEIAGGKAGAFRFMNALRIVRISNNLGDAKSLITHPATTTHERFAPEVRAAMGVGEGLVRLSAGLETSSAISSEASPRHRADTHLPDAEARGASATSLEARTTAPIARSEALVRGSPAARTSG